MALDFDFELETGGRLAARWEELAAMFIDPDTTEWGGYPVYGVDESCEGGLSKGELIDNDGELFEWVVKPIREDEDAWLSELESVERYNTITDDAIRIIEQRLANILPF